MNIPRPDLHVSRRRRLAAAALLLLSGCAGGPFERANKNYAEAFADAANTQLLLNIARLRNDEPAYFIQLGNFSTQFQLQASLGAPAAGSLYTKNYGGATASTVPTESIALGGTLGATAMENPTFNFTPLAGDAFMKTIFAPLPINVFSTMIGENWHADAVIRTMVSKIDILPAASGPVYSQPAVLHANPPQDKPAAADSTPASAGRNAPVGCKFGESVAFEASEADPAKFHWEMSSDEGRTWKTVPQPKTGAAAGPTYTESVGDHKSSLSIAGVTLDMSGSLFRARGTVDSKVTASDPAQLIVTGDEAPSFGELEPASQACTVTADPRKNVVTFSARATGTPTYHWQASMDQGANWKDVTDVASDGADSAASYKCTYNPDTKSVSLSIQNVSRDLDGNWYRCQARYDCMTLPNNATDGSYPLFLALCYELNEAQYNRLIPSVAKSVSDQAADNQAKEDAKKDALTFYNLKLSDALAAEAQGYTVENADTQDDSAAGTRSCDWKPAAYTVYKEPKNPDNTIEVQFPDASELDPSQYPLLHWIADHHEHIRFSLRSFDNALYEIAKEEERFEKVNRTFSSSPPGDGPSPARSQLALVPSDMRINLSPQSDSEHGCGYLAAVTGVAAHPGAAPTETPYYQFGVRPTLRTMGYRPDHKLVGIDYPDHGALRGGDRPLPFCVGDRADEVDATGRVIFAPDNCGATPSVTNCVEFTLLSYLFTQASIDSTKLPTQQIVEVH